MPIEVCLWQLGDRLKPLEFSRLDSEAKLEKAISEDLSVLSPQLMLIGRQVPTAHGKFIDLLAMDVSGDLSVIELKRHRTPRDVVAQLLDYASWIRTLTYEDIVKIYSDSNDGKEFEQGFAEAFDTSPPDELNRRHQLILVAAELDNSSERIISYLAEQYGVPINAVFFRYFRDGDREYLVRSWLINPQEAEAIAEKASSAKGKESWNGQDFYVNFGPPDDRDWEDARKYEFISGGGGKWFSQTLNQLFPGARVFVNVPGYGYVGVGKVVAPVVPMDEFLVEVDGKTIPIRDAPLRSTAMKNSPSDPEKAEHMVRVEWIKTVPLENAFREKGMYGNQNTVTKLRNRFTLERLVRHFGLEEGQ